MPSLALLRRSIQESALLSRSDMSALASSISHLVVRDDDSDTGSDNLINILLIILGIVFFTLIVVSILLLLRRSRRQRQMQGQQPILPTYNEAKNGHPNHRGLTIETSHHGRSSVLFISRDGQPMLQNPKSPPHSPDNVPQIHITFPDEQDDSGRRKSGRVVVVRVGENATIGLEPMHEEEQLPAYEKEAKDQFYSIDMDQIGGLKEKDRSVFEE